MALGTVGGNPLGLLGVRVGWGLSPFDNLVSFLEVNPYEDFVSKRLD